MRASVGRTSSLARPKSPILRSFESCAVNIKFSILMSRCATLRECMYAMPSVIHRRDVPPRCETGDNNPRRSLATDRPLG